MVTSEELLRQMYDYKKAQRRANLMGAIAAPGMLAQAIGTGQDPNSIWESWFPTEKLSPAEGIQAKQQALDALADLRKLRGAQGADLVKSLTSDSSELVKSYMDLFKSLKTTQMTQGTQAAIARLGADEKIYAQVNEQLKDYYKTQVVPGLRAAGDSRGNEYRSDTTFNPAKLRRELQENIRVQNLDPLTLASKILSVLPQSANPGDYLQAEQVFKEVTASAGSEVKFANVPVSQLTLQEFLSLGAGADESVARQAELTKMAAEALEQDVNKLNIRADEAMLDLLVAKENTLPPSSGLADFAKALVGTRNEIIKLGGPDLFGGLDDAKISELMETLFPEGRSGDPTEGYENLLETIDQNLEGNPTLADLKQQIMSSAEFREYMQTKGFMTEEEAWRQLKAEEKLWRQQARQKDRGIARDLRAEMYGEYRPGARDSAQLLGDNEKPSAIDEVESALSRGNLTGYTATVGAGGDVIIRNSQGRRFELGSGDGALAEKLLPALEEVGQIYTAGSTLPTPARETALPKLKKAAEQVGMGVSQATYSLSRPQQLVRRALLGMSRPGDRRTRREDEKAVEEVGDGLPDEPTP